LYVIAELDCNPFRFSDSSHAIKTKNEVGELVVIETYRQVSGFVFLVREIEKQKKADCKLRCLQKNLATGTRRQQWM